YAYSPSGFSFSHFPRIAVAEINSPLTLSKSVRISRTPPHIQIHTPCVSGSGIALLTLGHPAPIGITLSPIKSLFLIFGGRQRKPPLSSLTSQRNFCAGKCPTFLKSTRPTSSPVGIPRTPPNLTSR